MRGVIEMSKILLEAKKILLDSDYTCVLINNNTDIVYISKKKGVAPLLEYNEIKDGSELYLADKIIGKGAVSLAHICNVKELYTPIISVDARKLADKLGIYVEYDKEVPYIINRAGDGRCPIESSVLDCEDSEMAYEIIVGTLEKLKSR